MKTGTISDEAMPGNIPDIYKESFIKYFTNSPRAEWLKGCQERIMEETAKTRGVENTYVFDIDDLNYTEYFLHDLELTVVADSIDFEAEICEDCPKLKIISCLILDDLWISRIELMSQEIEKFVKSKGQLAFMNETLSFAKDDQIYLVKWISWTEIDKAMYLEKGDSWEEMKQQGIYKKNSLEHELKYKGKWFRGQYMHTICTGRQRMPTYCWFYLLDIGKYIIVPSECTFKPTCKFIVPTQLITLLDIVPNSGKQRTKEVQQMFHKTLQPGMKIQFQTICKAEDITCVDLINPTEEWVEQQYKEIMQTELSEEHAYFQETIEKKLNNLLSETKILDKDFYVAELTKMKREYIEKQENIIREDVYGPGCVPLVYKRNFGNYPKYVSHLS